MPLQRLQRHAKDASMTRVTMPARGGQQCLRNKVWKFPLSLLSSSLLLAVFVVFSKAKKELVLKFFGGIGKKVGPIEPYIEAGLILKYTLQTCTFFHPEISYNFAYDDGL